MPQDLTPQLSEALIRDYLGEESLSRGREYAQNGAIFEARRQGLLLKARCEGSREEPYRLRARLGPEGPAEADCTCPVGQGGRCKHVAALLLTFLEQPAEFLAVEDLETALGRKSKEELIALIKEMLARAPELEPLLEAPLRAPEAGLSRAEAYRRQAAAAFRRHGGARRAAAGVAVALDKLRAAGDNLLRQEDPEGAAAAYSAILSEALSHEELTHDDSGALIGLVNYCVEGLGRCLALLPSGEARREALKALFAVHRFDVDAGGLALGEEVPGLLMKHAGPEERRLLAGLVREALESSADWGRQAYGGLLLDLEADSLDDESFLQICRDTHRRYDLVERLLTLSRTGEALAEAKGASDYDLLRLAELLSGRGQAQEAERLVAERSEGSRDPRLLDWLVKRYAARGEIPSALSLLERRFGHNPDLASYHELRNLARELGRWQELRPGLLERLRSRNLDLLRQIHLEEGEIEEALRLLPPVRGAGFVENYPQLLTAEAAEETHPRAALEIYQQYAEALIETKSRPRYREACRYLEKVRDLYERLGEREAFARYTESLKERHRALPALLQELAAARL